MSTTTKKELVERIAQSTQAKRTVKFKLARRRPGMGPLMSREVWSDR